MTYNPDMGLVGNQKTSNAKAGLQVMIRTWDLLNRSATHSTLILHITEVKTYITILYFSILVALVCI
jgi:hypothetical protein